MGDLYVKGKVGRYCITSLICEINLLAKQKETHRLREQTWGCQGEGEGKGIVREFGMDRYTLLYLKWITNKDLLYSTGNSAQCYATA